MFLNWLQCKADEIDQNIVKECLKTQPCMFILINYGNQTLTSTVARNKQVRPY